MSLTESEIEALDGRELNAAADRYVMGNEHFRHKFEDNGYGWCTRCTSYSKIGGGILGNQFCDNPPPYCEDANLALEVIERLKGLGFGLFFEDMRLNRKTKDQQWWYEVMDWREAEKPENFGHPTHYWELDGGAETFPKAVCQAALKAVLLDGTKVYTDVEKVEWGKEFNELLGDDSGTTIPL